jgi:hypothetical protein
VVEVTTIREGYKFEDLDYPDEDEGIEKLVDAKETFILWPRKDIIVKTHSSLIVSPRSTEARGTSTSNMPKPAQISHPSATPPLTQNAQYQELQESTERRPTSAAKESQVPELQDNRERRPPSPARNPELQESTADRPPSLEKESEGLELQGNKEHTLPSPAQDQELQGNKEPSPPARGQEI